MALTKLEHFLVLTDDIDGTRDFYRDVLGFMEGFRPDLGFLGHWLYLGDIPVIHIAEWQSYTHYSNSIGIPVTTPNSSTGAFDHVAFNGNNAQEMIDRLVSRNVSFEQNNVPAISLIQLFLDDPNGVKIELNFT